MSEEAARGVLSLIDGVDNLASDIEQEIQDVQRRSVYNPGRIMAFRAELQNLVAQFQEVDELATVSYVATTAGYLTLLEAGLGQNDPSAQSLRRSIAQTSGQLFKPSALVIRRLGQVDDFQEAFGRRAQILAKIQEARQKLDRLLAETARRQSRNSYEDDEKSLIPAESMPNNRQEIVSAFGRCLLEEEGNSFAKFQAGVNQLYSDLHRNADLERRVYGSQPPADVAKPIVVPDAEAHVYHRYLEWYLRNLFGTVTVHLDNTGSVSWQVCSCHEDLSRYRVSARPVGEIPSERNHFYVDARAVFGLLEFDVGEVTRDYVQRLTPQQAARIGRDMLTSPETQGEFVNSLEVVYQPFNSLKDFLESRLVISESEAKETLQNMRLVKWAQLSQVYKDVAYDYLVGKLMFDKTVAQAGAFSLFAYHAWPIMRDLPRFSSNPTTAAMTPTFLKLASQGYFVNVDDDPLGALRAFTDQVEPKKAAAVEQLARLRNMREEDLSADNIAAQANAINSALRDLNSALYGDLDSEKTRLGLTIADLNTQLERLHRTIEDRRGYLKPILFIAVSAAVIGTGLVFGWSAPHVAVVLIVAEVGVAIAIAATDLSTGRPAKVVLPELYVDVSVAVISGVAVVPVGHMGAALAGRVARGAVTKLLLRGAFEGALLGAVNHTSTFTANLVLNRLPPEEATPEKFLKGLGRSMLIGGTFGMIFTAGAWYSTRAIQPGRPIPGVTRVGVPGPGEGVPLRSRTLPTREQLRLDYTNRVLARAGTRQRYIMVDDPQPPPDARLVGDLGTRATPARVEQAMADWNAALEQAMLLLRQGRARQARELLVARNRALFEEGGPLQGLVTADDTSPYEVLFRMKELRSLQDGETVLNAMARLPRSQQPRFDDGRRLIGNSFSGKYYISPDQFPALRGTKIEIPLDGRPPAGFQVGRPRELPGGTYELTYTEVSDTQVGIQLRDLRIGRSRIISIGPEQMKTLNWQLGLAAAEETSHAIIYLRYANGSATYREFEEALTRLNLRQHAVRHVFGSWDSGEVRLDVVSFARSDLRSTNAILLDYESMYMFVYMKKRQSLISRGLATEADISIPSILTYPQREVVPEIIRALPPETPPPPSRSASTAKPVRLLRRAA